MEQLLPALATLLAGLGALLAALAKRHAKQANEAVNQTHQRGTPRIYDMVFDLHTQSKELMEWKRSYDGGPLDRGDKVVQFVRHVDEELSQIKDDVHEIRNKCVYCHDDDGPGAA